MLFAPCRCSWQTETAKQRRCSSSSPCVRRPKRCAAAVAAMLLCSLAPRARRESARLNNTGHPRNWLQAPRQQAVWSRLVLFRNRLYRWPARTTVPVVHCLS